MSDSQVVVKKVNAYPFPVQFKTEANAFAGKVVKLTKTGFLAEVAITTLQPLEKLECSFVLPVLQKPVSEPVVVVKIYNHYVPAPAADAKIQPEKSAVAGDSAPGPAVAGVVHLVEMHFRAPSIVGQETVQTFLSALERSK